MIKGLATVYAKEAKEKERELPHADSLRYCARCGLTSQCGTLLRCFATIVCLRGCKEHLESFNGELISFYLIR